MTEQSLLHRAERCRATDRLGEALSIAKSVLKANPDSVAALLVLAEVYLEKERHKLTRKYVEAIFAIEPKHARAKAINAALPPNPSVQTTTIRVGGVKYLVVRRKSEIHEQYQLHAKKHVRPSNHSTQRWLERVGQTDLNQQLASCFKLILVPES